MIRLIRRETTRRRRGSAHRSRNRTNRWGGTRPPWHSPRPSRAGASNLFRPIAMGVDASRDDRLHDPARGAEPGSDTVAVTRIVFTRLLWPPTLAGIGTPVHVVARAERLLTDDQAVADPLRLPFRHAYAWLIRPNAWESAISTRGGTEGGI